jgi:D-psicose/D-tagatose/L-ribulose 3-epimerase
VGRIEKWAVRERANVAKSHSAHTITEKGAVIRALTDRIFALETCSRLRVENRHEEDSTVRTGMNLLLWTTHVTEEHFPTLERLKAAGFDGVEIPIFEGDEKHYRRLGQELQRLGLGCTAVTVVGPEASPISADASVRKAAVERLRWAISMAQACGAEILCGPFHSPLGIFTGTGPTEDEKQRAADVLRQAAEIAAQAGIRLAIEYLNRFECYFLTTAADARQLVQRVNHPAFRMMYDTFHANIEEKNIPQTIRSIADVMVHVHISENDRGVPGSGHVHWDDTFRTLRQVGYDGWLTIEAFGRALPALAAATKIWRDLFHSPEEVYQQGLAFIKSMWAKYAPA